MLDKIDPQTALKELFELAGIARVISVDDEYEIGISIEDVVGLCRAISPEQRAYVIKDAIVDDEDLLRDEITRIWDQLTASEKTRLHQQLIALQEPNSDTLIIWKDALTKLLTGWNLDYRPIRLAEWNDTKEQLLAEAETKRTLLLVDQDLSKDAAAGGIVDGGITLIQQALKARNDGTIVCGLLSGTFSAADAYDKWLGYKDVVDLDKFVLLAKEYLTDNMLGFVQMTKLTLLNRDCERLKKYATDVIKVAADRANARIAQIGVYDFEQIVFKSSRAEGVWEPDTFFRLFGMFNRLEALALAKAEPELHEVSNKIRRLSSVAAEAEAVPNPKAKAWEIQHQELYDELGYLCEHHMPLELGDIFEHTTSHKRYILLAQPCDLMVRFKEGTRHYDVVEGILAEIIKTEHGDEADKKRLAAGQFYEMPFYNETDDGCYFVSFRKSHSTSLQILDLCVFSSDGQSCMSMPEACPSRVIPAWQKYYEKLKANARRAVTEYSNLQSRNLPEPMRQKLAIQKFAEPIKCAGKIDPGKQSITFTCKRIKRFRQPRSGALLTQYSNYLARAAFDHELIKIPDSE